MGEVQRKFGHYLGTEIDHKWWRRYNEDGFFTRGSGEYWIKGGALFFQHRSKQQPIRLPLKDIAEIILCPCKRHATIGLKSIIKLIWQKDGKWLSSGFALSDSVEEVGGFLSSLRTSA